MGCKNRNFILLLDCFILKGNTHTYPTLSFNGLSYRLYHAIKRLYHNQTAYDGKIVDGVMVYDHCNDHARNKVDLSHLCHNKRCANPYHLIFEYTGHNVTRNGCIHSKKGCICNLSVKCILNNHRKVIVNKYNGLFRKVVKKTYASININRRRKQLIDQ